MPGKQLTAWVVLAALVLPGVGGAEGPPAPPADHPAVAVEAGQPWIAPPSGGVCLDQPAFTYQVNLRRWYELETKVAVERADNQPPGGLRVWLFAGTVGITIGVVGGLALAGKLKVR